MPAWLLGSGIIAVAMGVMNVSTYGFTILAARLLGPEQYGALAALMGLLLVVNVLSLGLQATAARRVSAAPEHTSTIEPAILSVSYRSALGLALVCLLASPAINAVLHLNDWVSAALVAVTVVPLTIMGGQAGVLQGERRWIPLAMIYLTSGLGRLLCGLVALLIRPDQFGAMVGVAVGAFFPIVVGWFALRHPKRVAHHATYAETRTAPAPASADDRMAAGRLIREVAHNSHALLAFFALSNADVIVARTTLPEHQAGLYAGGLILAKAVLFLPQFVVVIAFPSMASAGARRSLHLKSLGLVLGIGLMAVAGAALLSSLAVVFIGGGQYAALQGTIWAYAGLGTLLAMIQLMVYDVVARQHQRAVYWIWGALGLLLCTIPLIGSVSTLLTIVVSIDCALLMILVVVNLRRPGAAPPVPPAPPAAQREDAPVG
ncbi:MAG: lipopolysaccharide biosynthesis protein [Nocardioidaceae bacterium]